MSEAALAPAPFRAAHPVDLLLTGGDGAAALHILDDDAPGIDLHVALENRSDGGFRLGEPEVLVPRASSYHVELRFRPGVLDEDRLGEVQVTRKARARDDTGTWLFAHQRNDDRTISFFLLREQGTFVSPGERLHLTLSHIRAAVAGGSRVTQVEAVVRTNPAQPRRRANADLHRHERVRILSRRGEPVLPLEASWSGTDTVLNDGASQNELLLELVNCGGDRIEFDATGLDTATTFVVSDTATHDGDPRRLTDAAALAAMEVDAVTPGWSVTIDDEGARPVWLLRPIHPTGLDPGEALAVRLSSIISDAASGVAELAIDYANVPGHWDGRRTVTVRKAPLLFRDRPGTGSHPRVGIRTAYPDLDLAIGRPGTGLAESDGRLVLHAGGVGRLAIDADGPVDIAGRLTIGEAHVTGRLDVTGPIDADGPLTLRASAAAVDLAVANPDTGLKGSPGGGLAVRAGGRDVLDLRPDGRLTVGDGGSSHVLTVSGTEHHLTLTHPRGTTWTLAVGESGILTVQHVEDGLPRHIALLMEPDGDVAIGGNLKMGLTALTRRHAEALDALLTKGLRVRAGGSVAVSTGVFGSVGVSGSVRASFEEDLVLKVAP